MTQSSFDQLLASIQSSALPFADMDTDRGRDLIMTADLIWGYDPRQAAMPLFFGKERLEDIARGREAEFEHQLLLCFRLDLASDQQRALAELVQALRGKCCYRV